MSREEIKAFYENQKKEVAKTAKTELVIKEIERVEIVTKKEEVIVEEVTKRSNKDFMVNSFKRMVEAEFKAMNSKELLNYKREELNSWKWLMECFVVFKNEYTERTFLIIKNKALDMLLETFLYYFNNRIEEVVIINERQEMFPIENYEEINNDGVVIYNTEVKEELVIVEEEAIYDIKGKEVCIEVEEEVIDIIIDDNTIDTIIEEGKREIDILYRGKGEPISEHLVDLVLIVITKSYNIGEKVKELILKALKNHYNILKYKLIYKI